MSRINDISFQWVKLLNKLSLKQHRQNRWCWEEFLRYSYAWARIAEPISIPLNFSFSMFGSRLRLSFGRSRAEVKYVWPCQREKDYCISKSVKSAGWATERRLSSAPAFYKSEAPQSAVAPQLFKDERQAELSEQAFWPGSQPLKFLFFDDVRL